MIIQYEVMQIQDKTFLSKYIKKFLISMSLLFIV